MTERFLIFGHRGSPRRFPENTIASFDEALRAGADGFETDLRLLSDNTAILYHDDELNGADIESLTVPDLGKRVEKVAALAKYAGRALMVLEIKRSKWEDALLDLIAGWPDIVIASFDHSLIVELHRRKVNVPLGITTFGWIDGIAAYAGRLGATWHFPNFRYVDAESVAALHDLGVRTVPWTANRVADWEALRKAGCDGVITDVPHDAVAWRAAVR
jgi:glycerophosphoryl diester phosphodiesterase